jgi:thermitase
VERRHILTEGEGKMKKTLITLLLLELILVNTLSVALPKQATAQNSEGGNTAQNAAAQTIKKNADGQHESTQDIQNNLSTESSESSQSKTVASSHQPPADQGNRWNFQDPSAWSSFSYMNGNNTRIIVGVDGAKPSDLRELETIAAENRAKIVNTVTIGGKAQAAVVELPLTLVASFSERIRALNLASYMEPDMNFTATLIPNDPYWSLQWGPQKIQADQAWDTTVGSSSVLVAIVDTGIDYTHPDIAPNYALGGYDWVNNDTDPMDDNGHGTHCAGIIAAAINNNIGIAGLAQVRVMAEKGLDSSGWGTEDWLANAIVHAVDAGAKIISMSWGGYGDSQLIYDAITYAYDAGVLLVAAAGNDATNMKLYPAGYKEVIAVAATDESDQPAWFSNYGDWIDLAAPGVDIYSTVPWGYASMSGTSMACPHVSGVAALVWSLYPDKARDWVREWLKYTADDLGDPGYDVRYGYGRVNAANAVEWAPPEHELIAYSLQTPPYVEPNTTAIINATVLNFGTSDETDLNVQLLANGAIVDSEPVASLASGNSATFNLPWMPTAKGLYNITAYVIPVLGETNLENNALTKFVYAGSPVKAVVLHSAGNVYAQIITNWQALNNQWYLFGDTMVIIDYTSLNKDDITYEDIAATGAKVLIISCAYDPYAGWEFTDSEIRAISRYVHEGHGLIATAGTLYYEVPNNNKLAPLFGINATTSWTAVGTDLLNLVNASHPLFKNVPNPFVFEYVGSSVPSDGRWDQDELIGGRYLALGQFLEGAIVCNRGLVFISPWLEVIPDYYRFNLQLLYNAITWSSYQKPEHDLTVDVQAPSCAKNGQPTLLNATVSNIGKNTEESVQLQLLINGTPTYTGGTPELPPGTSYTITYSWTPPIDGVYNITAYSPPVAGEDSVLNNIATVMTKAIWIIIKNALVYTDDYVMATSSRYPIAALEDLCINYTACFDPTSFEKTLNSQAWDMVIVDHCDYYWPLQYWTELETYVQNGGLLIVATFNVEATTTLWQTMGASWVSDIQWPEPVYQWVPSHPLFRFPNTVGNLTNYMYAYYDNGDHVQATTGTSIAGFTSGPVYPSNCSAIVAGNDYKTLLFSFILDNFRYDENLDGIVDAVELWENAVAYVARAPEHELVAALQTPKHLKPSQSTLLNATVENLGRNSETNFQLELWIGNTKVASTTISQLLTGDSYTISYLWTPTVEATYNITAYAEPVPGEDNVRNNARTARVVVTTLIVALFMNNEPWNSPSDEQALDKYSIQYDVFSADDFGHVDLSNYKKAVIASDQDQNFYDAVGNYLSWFEQYVSSGGILEIHAADWAWHGGHWVSPLPGGLTLNTYFSDYATIIDSSHPVLTTPNPISDEELDQWHSSVHGYFSSYPGYSNIVIVEEYTQQPVYIEFQYVRGYIVATSQPLEWGYMNGHSRILENSLLYIPAAYEHDIAVQLSAPKYVEEDTTVTLGATVRNKGLDAETNLQVYLMINGAIADNNTIASLSSEESYTMSYDWTPTHKGQYNITAYAPSVQQEGYLLNNNASKIVGVFHYRMTQIPPEWIQGGQPMGWHADDMSWLYTLPFDFPFYGINYRTIYISSNGLITFKGPDTQYYNSQQELARKLAIAPAWRDWVTYDPGDIYIWQNTSEVVINWYAAAYFNRSILVNFEALLRQDGFIQFNYASNDTADVYATAGISNGVNHILADDLTNLYNVDSIVFDPYTHDVAIQDISASPTQAYAGQEVSINVTALNEGDAAENFNVTLYYTPTGNPNIPTEPHSGNCMWIEPSITNLEGMPVHGRFNITVWINFTSIDPGDHIAAWQFQIAYDRSCLSATRAGYTRGQMSEWFEQSNMTSNVALQPVIRSFNVTHDYVLEGESWMSGPMPNEGSYGSLSWIEFEVTDTPTQPLSGSFQFITFGAWACDIWNENTEDVASQFNFIDGQYTFQTIVPQPPTIIGTTIIGTTIIGTQTVINLQGGSSTILSFEWNTTGTPLGNYTLIAVASTVPGETHVEDNVYIDGTVEILWVHDVSITDVEPSRTWVYHGSIIRINVTAENKGNSTEDVMITVYYNLTSGEEVGSQLMANLLPNEYRTITLTWNTLNAIPYRNYTITATATIPEFDINPADNAKDSPINVNVRILGDANNDGKVDVRDILMVAKAFGETPDRSRWNKDFDLNSDNRINVIDILIVAQNYGKRA